MSFRQRLIESQKKRAEACQVLGNKRPQLTNSYGWWSRYLERSCTKQLDDYCRVNICWTSLRDDNVEYRNSDDSVNQRVCGSGCGVCPSVKNFQITSDKLPDQIREIFSQFLPMQWGTVIGLDKAHSSSWNPYWETGWLRPDLVLTDLITIMHPDLNIQGKTIFPNSSFCFEYNGNMVVSMSWLPEYPNDWNIHVTFIFLVDISNPPSSLLGAPHFVVLDQFYPAANVKIATAICVDVADMEIVIVEKMKYSPYLTVRIPGCQKSKTYLWSVRRTQIEWSFSCIRNSESLGIRLDYCHTFHY